MTCEGVRAAVLVAAAAVGCSASTGPVPSLDRVEPEALCVAEGGASVTIHGAGFSPVAELQDTPTLVMPRVLLVDGDTSIEIPADGVSMQEAAAEDSEAGAAVIVAAIPDGLAGPVESGVPPGVYTLRVENPSGAADALPSSLTLLPLPGVSAVEPSAAAPAAPVQLTIEGSDFRDPTTVVLDGDNSLAATAVTVESPTELVVDVDLTFAEPGTYDVVVTGPDGCSATLEEGFTVEASP